MTFSSFKNFPTIHFQSLHSTRIRTSRLDRMPKISNPNTILELVEEFRKQAYITSITQITDIKKFTSLLSKYQPYLHPNIIIHHHQYSIYASRNETQ